MTGRVVAFPRLFTVRDSTLEEASRLGRRVGPKEKLVFIVDHVEGDEIPLPVPVDAVVHDSDHCAHALLRQHIALTKAGLLHECNLPAEDGPNWWDVAP